MDLVDRIAIIVRPKEPYLAWARSLEGDAPAVDAHAADFGTVYLAETGDREGPEQVLRRHFAVIFEEELDSWHRAEASWPKRRTFKMFHEWFDVQVAGLVFDLGKGSEPPEE